MEQNTSLMHYILYWIISGIGVLITSKLIRGFEVRGFFTACFAALIIGFANTFLWPFLIFITLPINFLTLGLFTFVVNGAVLKIAAAVMPGFEIKSWFTAIFGAVVLSVINLVLHYIFF